MPSYSKPIICILHHEKFGFVFKTELGRCPKAHTDFEKNKLGVEYSLDPDDISKVEIWFFDKPVD